MKKIISIFLCLFILIGAIPISVSAVEKENTDSVGVGVYIETYEQLKNFARLAQPHNTFILANDIVQEDNENDNEVVIENIASFILDLNGHSITRITRGIDEALFVVKGYMTIYDSSKAKTGGCTFYSGMSDSYKSVFRVNSGQELRILSGNYTIKSPYNTGVCSTVYSEGNVYIYDGTFDSSDAWCGYSVFLIHNAYIYDVPKCVIYGGKFYAKYTNIEAYSFDNYTSYGCMYPSVYVLGGEFYIKEHNTEDASFAYCNNGWGTVITAEGTIYLTDLNMRDRRYIDGVSKKNVKAEVNGTNGNYLKITAPPMILGGDLDYQSRLLNMCLKKDVERYSKTGKVYQANIDIFDKALNYVDTINVDKYTTTSPYISLTNYTTGDKVNWYLASSSYQGENTAWTEITSIRDNFSQWRLSTRPENKASVCIRAVVTRTDGTTAEDIIQIDYEELSRTMQGTAVFDITNPCYKDTVGVGVTGAPSWQDSSTYTYEWKVDGKVVNTYSQFYISDPSYIGKTLTCTVRSTKYDGELTTSPVIIGKAQNDNQVYAIDAEYYNGNIFLYNVRQDQEYLFSTKTKQSLLTEADWKNAVKTNSDIASYTLDYLGLQSYVGKTIYIYTRYYETSTHQAGEYVVNKALKLENVNKVISHVSISGIDAPIAGKTPDITAQTDSVFYTVTNINWYDDTDQYGQKISNTTRFVAGRTYRVVVEVTTVDGCTYLMDDVYNDATGSINGNTATAYGSHSDTQLEIGYRFPPCEQPDSYGLLGDANEDGIINVMDATSVQKYLAGLSSLSDTGMYLADVDSNGIVNIMDATTIQKYLAGLETGYQIGELV